jgi:hypothetical protein
MRYRLSCLPIRRCRGFPGLSGSVDARPLLPNSRVSSVPGGVGDAALGATAVAPGRALRKPLGTRKLEGAVRLLIEGMNWSS